MLNSHLNLLSKLVVIDSPSQINLADNSALFAYGKGNVQLTIYSNSMKHDIELTNVLYVPKIQTKLLSLPAVMDQGNYCSIQRKLLHFCQ